MTIVIHFSHTIQYSPIHISFPLCHWLRHPSVSQTASFTPFCAPNQPSYHSIPLNQIFSHSLDHQTLDSRQPALQPVSQSCTLYALSQAGIHSSKKFVVHLAQQSAIQPFSQPISHSPARAVTQPFALLVSPSRSHSQLLCVSVFHSFTHSLGVLSVILSLFRPHSQLLYQPFTLSPTHQVFCQSLFHPLVHTQLLCHSVFHSLTHSPGVLSVNLSFSRPHSQLLCQSVFHSFTYSAFFHALSQVTGHPASHAITTCVIAITVTIGTAALIAAAVRQFDTAPNRYSNKNPRCTNVPATQPPLRYIIMQFTFRTKSNFYWRRYN